MEQSFAIAVLFIRFVGEKKFLPLREAAENNISSDMLVNICLDLEPWQHRK